MRGSSFTGLRLGYSPRSSALKPVQTPTSRVELEVRWFEQRLSLPTGSHSQPMITGTKFMVQDILRHLDVPGCAPAAADLPGGWLSLRRARLRR
jgi:hypothetical protein